jgi:hypothetical protein
VRPSSDKYLDVPAPYDPGMTITLSDPPSNRPELGKLTAESNDPIYLVDSDPIKLCDLGPRHTVVRQGVHATELGDRYIAGLALSNRLSPYLLRFRGRFDFRRTHRHHRWDREDTWLSPRLISRRGVVRGRCWYLCTCGLLLWLEQVFRNLVRSVDPFTIVASASRLSDC